MITPDLQQYAQKMRDLAAAGVDLETDARFLDALLPRRARVLDLGCGIGAAVNALRRAGHLAWGIDTSGEVLQVAAELFDPAWYRRMPVTDIGSAQLQQAGLIQRYDGLLMAGNVAAFLSARELAGVFRQAGALLDPQGVFILGTTAAVFGGPEDQDRAAEGTGLKLLGRYADWHLRPFTPDSPWCVSIFAPTTARQLPGAPDGIFVLGGQVAHPDR